MTGKGQKKLNQIGTRKDGYKQIITKTQIVQKVEQIEDDLEELLERNKKISPSIKKYPKSPIEKYRLHDLSPSLLQTTALSNL